MAAGSRFVFDTTVYVAAVRGGVFSPPFRLLQERLPRTHLASVVSAELRAGATSERARRAVHDLTRWASRVGRLVTPSAATWDRAGEVLGQIRRKDPSLRSKVPRLWNDLLIALVARQIGATAVTYNAEDFQLLRRFHPFRLEVLS